MSNIINISGPGEAITMTSLEMVDYINSERAEGDAELRHDSFMAKVPKVLGEAAPKFVGTAFYVNGTGAKVERAIYTFPKREACLMAMSYSYDLQAKVFDRMTALEAQAEALGRFNLPKTYSEAMRLAADEMEKREELQTQLALASPKAAALDRISTFSEGSYCLRDAAKVQQVAERKFIQYLDACRWIYQQAPGQWRVYAEVRKDGLMEQKTTTGQKPDGSEWLSVQVRVTSKGMTKLARVFESEGAPA